MRSKMSLLAGTATLSLAQATSLADVCTSTYARSVAPSSPLMGVTVDTSSVTANPVYNYSSAATAFWAASTFDFCNVTLSYSHNGLDDQVLLQFWLPAPADFQNRWLSTGGFGYAINGDSADLPGGVMYGAASGQTDGGFGGFSTEFDAVFLKANGTIDREALYMGGREGWSQVQRFAEEWDGAVIGAPAIRYGQKQPNHLFPGLVEQTMGYYPPPCELEKINNLTIAACDALDGKKDGVVSRTDLCKLHFNINSTIGAPYYCPAETTTTVLKKRLSTSNTTPAQNGTVSKEGAAVAAKILEGLKTLDGKRAYIWYQPSATFDDAETQYNSETGEWELDITSLGGEWVAKFLELLDVDNLSTMDNVTYDTMKDWMELGWQRYEDVLQTTWPDLTPFHSKGGKIIHVHGESDPSIPTGSSVHYHESVRQQMYGSLSFNESTAALNDWNRLYLVPGAAHCSYSSDQPNGGWPQTTLLTLIDWVENGQKPDRLNATVQEGSNTGEHQELCAWPLRPFYVKNGTELTCVWDEESYQTWVYDFDAYNLPLY
ncbi:tannase and feruloyl esterase [Aspergillus ibericus CBS 121593]|uniref:Carboxylic ester hydrolase n=1 Tax=Aspergillus ibericus CBS 121593 TaxID=1448316 RepID=A0A395GII0_9EURO|nr:tannase and feruloyl esterase [Aspergillus ibericus CBS 121593]RAK95164.1 tannase and feruloyl esterase [Aspergillus ibericus CBS 121593]